MPQLRNVIAQLRKRTDVTAAASSSTHPDVGALQEAIDELAETIADMPAPTEHDHRRASAAAGGYRARLVNLRSGRAVEKS
jgi:hypothetical protein